MFSLKNLVCIVFTFFTRYFWLFCAKVFCVRGARLNQIDRYQRRPIYVDVRRTGLSWILYTIQKINIIYIAYLYWTNRYEMLFSLCVHVVYIWMFVYAIDADTNKYTHTLSGDLKTIYLIYINDEKKYIKKL